MMNANVSRVVAMVSQTVTRITQSPTVSAAAARIALLVLVLSSCSSVANAQIEWRISVKVFLDESGDRLCLLEPDDCRYADCCYDSDEEIRTMFEGPDSTLAFLKERGITFGEIEIVELGWGDLPEVPDEMDRSRYFGHYCREGAADDDGPCDPLTDDPCRVSRVCVERPVEYYCDDDGHYLSPCDPNDADPCPDGGTCMEKPYRWYNGSVRRGHVTRTLRECVHEDAGEGEENRFRYDPEAVNVYLFPAYFGGRCECDSWDGPNPRAILTIGHGKGRTVPSHELGHFMGLCHTHSCTCGVECGEPRCCGGENHDELCVVDADCPDGVCCKPGDDQLADTLPDSERWDQDCIAQYSFDVDYDEATSSQKEQVDNVYYNVMSYHGKSPPRLTSDQLDRMMDVSGTTWFAIAERCTFFVDGDPDVPPILTGHMNCSREGPRPDLDGDENGYPDTQLDGSSVNPLSTVAGALNEAGDGDIVMIRGGYYDEQLTIDQPVFLRASDGNAVIGMTGP